MVGPESVAAGERREAVQGAPDDFPERVHVARRCERRKRLLQLGERLSGQLRLLPTCFGEIEVGEDGLKALLAYPGPSVNPDALRERSATGANRTRHAFSCDPVEPVSLEHAARKQPETPTWQS